MTKKLYLPLLVALVAVLTSCSSKMGELSSDYFTVTPQVLEAVGGKVPATINGKFPEKYFKKKAVVEVTPVLRWEGGEAKGQPAVFQGEKVEGNDQTISYKAGGSYTMKTSFDYVPEMAKSELYLEFKAKVGKKEVTFSHLDTTAAVGLAVPFALIGQYMVTFLFTLMSPMMSKADQLAAKGDTKGIVRLNYIAMALLGLLFAIVCTLGMLGGSAMGTTLSNLAAKYAWIMAGLGAAGGMMRFVGFATLLRIMLSNEFWGIYFAGFALATIIGYIPELSGSALLLIAFVGVAIALYDYQTRVAIKQAAGSGFAANGGDDEDGI